ncbi:MAG: hypothetical protein H7A25_06065 [Leptospiraceae bacterium]|nr:hypothetical protein [Leptospiraceae bacterium]MCP5499448.1 hypothetical protein [Leptospiraceae bacterium]
MKEKKFHELSLLSGFEETLKKGKENSTSIFIRLKKNGEKIIHTDFFGSLCS